MADFVNHYNTRRLHSAIGYLTPKDKLDGRAETILVGREAKLAAARDARKAKRKSARGGNNDLTTIEQMITMPLAGETEAGSAEEQPARDSRLGKRRDVAVGAALTGCPHSPHFVDALHASENLSLHNSTDSRV